MGRITAFGAGGVRCNEGSEPGSAREAVVLISSRTLKAASDDLRRQRRQVLRVALQTGVATLAAYLLIDRIAPAHLS